MRKQFKSVGGFMVFPIIVMVVGPRILLAEIHQGLPRYLRLSTWRSAR